MIFWIRSIKPLYLYLILVLLLSLPGIADLARPGYYTSHDGFGHVIRMDEFYRSLSDGMFPVRWSGRLYNGYGYPFFNFNYPLVYALGVPFMTVGLSAVTAMKALTALSFTLSGLFMYLYLQKKFDFRLAVVGATLYMYAPYRLSNIYVRGSVAEAVSFIFPPLVLWAAENISENKSRSLLFASFLIGIIGISHNISALLLFGFYFLYSAFLSIKNKSLRPLLKSFFAFLVGLSLASFFFVPALIEKKYTFLDNTIAKDYPSHFISLSQLIKPGWGFGSSIDGPQDGMTFHLGIIQTVLALTTIFLFLRLRPRLPTLLAFTLTLALTSIFMMLPISKFIWDRLPLLPFVQFPWRFEFLTTPALAIIGTYSIQSLFDSLRLRPRLRLITIVLTLTLTLILSIYMWFRNETITETIPDGRAIPGTTTWADEQATRWLVPKPDHIPAQPIETFPISQVSISFWKSGHHEYQIINTTPVTVVEHTMYYPGWRIWTNQKELQANYQDPVYPGQLVFDLLPGNHLIKSRFTETPFRLFFDLLSIGTLLTLTLLLLRPHPRP